MIRPLHTQSKSEGADLIRKFFASVAVEPNYDLYLTLTNRTVAWLSLFMRLHAGIGGGGRRGERSPVRIDKFMKKLNTSVFMFFIPDK